MNEKPKLSKRISRMITVIVAIILATYFGLCLNVSLKINYIVASAINSVPYNFTLKNVIDEFEYEALCLKQPECEEGLRVRRFKFHTPSVTFLFNKKAYFLWHYVVKDKDTKECIYATSMAVPVVHFESVFPLRILEVDTL